MNTKLIRFVLICICLFLAEINAQVFNGDLTLTSQAEIDVFNYTSVTGDLIIREQEAGNIVNLNGLSELKSVGILFLIRGNTALINLDPLSNLTAVYSLVIEDNPALNNINGLSNVISTGYLSIQNNDALINIDALSKITVAEQGVFIKNNASLLNINGLSNLQKVSGSEVQIDNNPSLQNIDGFQNLLEVWSITIADNQVLTTINGFQILHTVRGFVGIVINNNALLESINGFTNLNILGNLEIFNNPSLTVINGLNIFKIDQGGVTLSNNPMLISYNGLSNIQELFHIRINDCGKLTSVNLPMIETGGSLRIFNNEMLEKINGLSPDRLNLLDISNNPSLTGIEALSTITSVFDLTIKNNDALNNLDGLSSLNTAFHITIDDNDDLADIDSLSNLSSLLGSFLIINNLNLLNLDGLSNLFSVRERIEISNNASLSNIDGLSLLSFVGSNLIINGNEQLTRFCGLHTLLSGGFTNFTITGNGTNPGAQQIISEGPCSIPGLPASSYLTVLLGKNFVPPVITDVTGGGMFTLNETRDTLRFWIRIASENCKVTEVHFHNGAAGVNGPVVKNISVSFVIFFSSDSVSRFSLGVGMWTSSDTEPLTAELINQLLGGNIYIDIHTEAFPKGAIRGQITNNIPVNLYANLEGSREIPPVNTFGSGQGSFILSGDGSSLEYNISAGDLSAPITAAHFHSASVHSLGPVVNTISFTGNISAGTWINTDPQPLTPKLVADLLGAHIYVNVHTQNFPEGEIRGQLFKTKTVASSYMTIWAANNIEQQNNSTLSFYSLAEGENFKNIEGDITGYSGKKNIADLTIDIGSNIYFLNNSWTSILYRIDPEEIDFDPSTPVTAAQIGKTRTLPDEKLVRLSKIKFIVGKLYGLNNETNKLYEINTADASVIELAVLNELDSQSAGFTLAADGIIYILKSISQNLSEIWKFDQFPAGNLTLVTAVTSLNRLESFTSHPNGNLYAADQKNLYEINLINRTIGVLKDYEVEAKGIDFNFFAEKNSDVVETLEFNLLTGVTSVDQFSALPADYSLAQNYPNPFNPSTTIKFSLPHSAFVKLSIYDMLGEKVSDIISVLKEAGFHSVDFNAASLPSGVYIYTITAGDFIDSKKFILLK